MKSQQTRVLVPQNRDRSNAREHTELDGDLEAIKTNADAMSPSQRNPRFTSKEAQAEVDSLQGGPQGAQARHRWV